MHDGYRSILAAAFALSASFAAGCQAFDRAQYRALEADADAGAGEAAAPGSCLALRETNDAGCARAIVPTAPAAAPDQPSNGRTYVLAARRIEIGPSSFGNWRQIGFDLDSVCTDATSTPAQRSCMGRQPVVDGDDGRDNAFGSAVATGLYVMDTFRDSTLTAGIATGRLTLGLRITEWGGGDDRRVSVDWLHLVEGRPAMGTSLAWDGTDRWKIEPSFSLAADRTTAIVRSTDAFVACGYTRARLGTRLPIVLFSGTEQRILTIRNPVMAGPVEPTAGGIADVAGFWVREDIVDSLPWFGVCPAPNGPMDVFDTRLTGIESNFDVRSDSTVNPMMPCDAASIAIRFEWKPVQVDGVASSGLPTVAPCAADAGR